MLRRYWVAGLAGFGLLVTVTAAAASLAAGHRAAGIEVDWPRLLLWQGLAYGSWVPIGWGLSVFVRRIGFGARLVAVLYGLGLLVTVGHSAFAAGLDVVFSPIAEADEWRRRTLGRMPIDMLIYLALATFIAAVQAQRLAAGEARRAALLAEALASARLALEQRASTPAEAVDRLMVAVGSRRVPVEAAEVEWFASAGNYVVVNWAGREGLVRDTLQGLERRLDPAVFARSHRSTLVNLAKVADAASLSDGSWRLTTVSGAELVASRTYRDEILRRLGRG